MCVVSSGKIHCIVVTPRWVSDQMAQRWCKPRTTKCANPWTGRVPSSGGVSTAVTRETPVVSPRLIPVPDSPHLSLQLPPEPEVDSTGKTSASFDPNCAPSQAPASGSAKYDQLSNGQLHELCRQRGYHKKDTKAVLRTRLEAMDAAAKKTAEGSSNDMDSSMRTRFTGKRSRCTNGTMEMGTEVGGDNEKRPRNTDLAIALEVDMEVVKEHAQWWNPELKPQVEAQQSSVAEGVGGAVSARV